MTEDAQHTDSRVAAMARRFEKPVLLASVLVIPAIIVETSAKEHSLREAAALLNWLIWLVFVAELASILAVAPSRWQWIRSNPLMVTIVLVTAPFCRRAFKPHACSGSRASCGWCSSFASRVASSPQPASSSPRSSRDSASSEVPPLQAAEASTRHPPTLWDSVWWAMATVATVGYGDVTAHTTLGRVIAIVLMVMGIGFVALLTAAIAQRLLRVDAERIEQAETRVEVEEHAIAEEFKAIAERLAALERRVIEREHLASSEG